MALPAPQIPDAWQSPDGSRQIPGCSGVREVAGVRVYTIEGSPHVSTSTVLRLSPWGRVEHVPQAALDYGAARGSWVDQACQLVDDGTLDWDGTDWEQRYDGKRMVTRPYVEAYAAWVQGVEVLETEGLVVAGDCRTFGFRDRVVRHPKHGQVVVDLKTSAVLTDRERLQLSSYATNATDAMLLLQLTKDGRAVEHWVPDWPAYRERFRRLADEAHRWLEAQEARR